MYVRITEGGPIILGFRFTQNSYFGTSYREGTFSSYTAFSDPLKNFIMVLQSVGHFLYCALRTGIIFILELCREDGPFLILRFKVRPKFYFRITDGGPFFILDFVVRLRVVVLIIQQK